MDISLFQVSYVGLWLVALLLVPISLSVLYRLAFLSEHVSELSVPKSAILGTPIPGTTALDLSSGVVRAEHEWKAGIRVFLVLSARNSSCKSILKGLPAMRIDDIRRTPFSILCTSPLKQCRTMFMTISGASVPFLKPDKWPEHMEIAVGGLPAILVVDGEHKIRDIRKPTSAHDLMSFLKAIDSEIHGPERGAKPVELSQSVRQSVLG